jgi:hypothetical protein
MRLLDLAHARSGDKGAHANIAVIARSDSAYAKLCALLTPQRVRDYFGGLDCGEVTRYELPRLRALNFVCRSILGRGGSVNLRIDAQGKTLAQALLLMELPDE